MKLKELELHETTSTNTAGEILQINKSDIIVACQKGSIKLTSVQLPSKKAIQAVDFVRGARLEVGSIL